MANLEFCDKHNMVAYLEKSKGSKGFHQIIDFLSVSHIHYALTKNPTIYASLIEQFWQTTALSTTKDGVNGITATIDGRVKTITEASLRRHLKLEDSEGNTSLPTTEIFEQLALMGYEITSNSLTSQKGHFSPQWKFFIHTILHWLSPKKSAWDQFSSNIATAIICLATNRTFNFSKFIFDAMVKNLDSPHKFLMYPRVITPLFDTMLVQPQVKAPSTPPSRITSSPSLSSYHTPLSSPSTSQSPTTPTEKAAPMPYESPLYSVHSLGSDEGSMQQNELMDLVTKLKDRVKVLETDLPQTKKTYSTALTKLILRVKKLENTVKSGKAKRRARIVISEDKDAAEDSSKHGRILIEELDMDAGISLVPPHAADEGRNDDIQVSDQPTEQLGVFSAATALADAAKRRRRSVESVQTYIRIRRDVSTDSGRVITSSRTVSTADVSTTSELGSTAGVKAKDKGKAIM
ncbi:hypothetical protein Tco_0490765 [Tanacetum coccineum]